MIYVTIHMCDHTNTPGSGKFLIFFEISKDWFSFVTTLTRFSLGVHNDQADTRDGMAEPVFSQDQILRRERCDREKSFSLFSCPREGLETTMTGLRKI